MISQTLKKSMGIYLWDSHKLDYLQIFIEVLLSAVGLVCGILAYGKIESPTRHFELVLVMIFYTLSILCVIPMVKWGYLIATGISLVLMLIFLVTQIVLAFMNENAKTGGAAYKIATWIFICYVFGAVGLPAVFLLLTPNIKWTIYIFTYLHLCHTFNLILQLVK